MLCVFNIFSSQQTFNRFIRTMSKNLKINQDLQDERDKVNFSVEEFTNFYYGGVKNVQEKRSLGLNNFLLINELKLLTFLFLEKYFLSDPELNLSLDMSYLSYKEKYEEAVRRSVIVHKKLIKLLLDSDGGLEAFT